MKRRSIAVLLGVAMAGGLAATAQADSDTGGSFVPLSAVRLADSRTGAGGLGTTPLGSGETRTVQVTGEAGMPNTGVSAVVVDVAAVGPTAATYLTLWPTGYAQPTASHVNAPADQTVSNSAVIPVGSDGAIFVRNASGSANVVIDVQGYFTSGGGTGTVEGGFVPTTVSRLLDTRTGRGTPDGVAAKIPAGSSIDVQVTGQVGVPSDAAAIFTNVVAVTPPSSGYITVYPTGEGLPTATTVNYGTQTLSSAAVAKIGDSGKVTVYNGNDYDMDVLIDVQGYFAGGSGGGGSFTARRALVFNTPSGTPLGPNESVDIAVAGTNAIPAYDDMGAAFLNFKVTAPERTGFVRFWPTGATEPGTTNGTFIAGQDRSFLTAARFGELGKVTVRNVSDGTIYLRVDLQGWFTPSKELVDLGDGTTVEVDPTVDNAATEPSTSEAWIDTAPDPERPEGSELWETLPAFMGANPTSETAEDGSTWLVSEDGKTRAGRSAASVDNGDGTFTTTLTANETTLKYGSTEPVRATVTIHTTDAGEEIDDAVQIAGPDKEDTLEPVSKALMERTLVAGGAEQEDIDSAKASWKAADDVTDLNPTTVASASDMGCDGRPYVGGPLVRTINSWKVYFYASNINCMLYRSGASWWVGEKITTSYKTNQSYLVPTEFSSAVVHAGGGNVYADFEPIDSFSSSWTGACRTINMGVETHGAGISRSEQLCDGIHYPLGPTTQPKFGSRWKAKYWYIPERYYLSNPKRRYGIRSTGILYSPPAASYSRNHHLQRHVSYCWNTGSPLCHAGLW